MQSSNNSLIGIIPFRLEIFRAAATNLDTRGRSCNVWIDVELLGTFWLSIKTFLSSLVVRIILSNSKRHTRNVSLISPIMQGRCHFFPWVIFANWATTATMVHSCDASGTERKRIPRTLFYWMVGYFNALQRTEILVCINLRRCVHRRSCTSLTLHIVY